VINIIVESDWLNKLEYEVCEMPMHWLICVSGKAMRIKEGKKSKLDKIKCQFCNVIAYFKLACKTMTMNAQITSSKFEI